MPLQAAIGLGGAGASPHRPRVEEVRGAGRADDAPGPGRLRDTHDRPEVAGVLDAEDENDGAWAREDLRRGNVAPLRDRPIHLRAQA